MTSTFLTEWKDRPTFRTDETRHSSGEPMCEGRGCVSYTRFSLSSFKPFKVLATETLSEKALDADVYNAVATEKVDGTCCYVTNYKGKIQRACLLKVLLYKSAPSELGIDS